MPEYRRARVHGATVFLTLVTYRRRPILTEKRVLAALRASLRDVQARRAFEMLAWVVLTDHLHVIWSLPIGDRDFSSRVGMFKIGVTRRLGGMPHASASRLRRRESGVWQRRFWEHTVRDADDLRKHMQYIHWNPVKHGVASCPHAWPHSSFHAHVRRGSVDPKWGCSCGVNEFTEPALESIGDAGEPLQGGLCPPSVVFGRS
jgi:putative transposase